jgi:hypothetical protein
MPTGVALVFNEVILAPAVTMLELAPPPAIAVPLGCGCVIPDVEFAPDGVDSARASSSRSSNVSCLTALMEYAQMPAATPKTETPRIAFFTRYGARARFRPGDMTYDALEIGSDGQGMHAHSSLDGMIYELRSARCTVLE